MFEAFISAAPGSFTHSCSIASVNGFGEGQPDELMDMSHVPAGRVRRKYRYEHTDDGLRATGLCCNDCTWGTCGKTDRTTSSG